MTIHYSVIYIVGSLLALLLSVLWIALPFAVFGLKRRIDRSNELLREIRGLLQRGLASERPAGQDIFNSGKR